MGRPRLPPLNAIKAFEAAARLGSFTRAAEELNVTHGAVSRQVRLLEDWLGTRCSCAPAETRCRRRRGRICSPRPDLRSIASRPCLSACASPCRPRRCSAVSALPTFAMRWLIPRLPEFQRDHPGLELQIVTASTPAEQFRMDVDAVISGPWRQSGLGRKAVSRRSAIAGPKSRFDGKMPAANTGRS